MKPLLAIAAVLGVGVLAVFVMNNMNVQEYTKPTVVTEFTEVVEEIDKLEIKKEQQWEDRKEEAERKAQTAYDAVMEKERIESDLDVVRTAQTELDELEVQLMASSSLVAAPTQ